jgi:hypothetical protein
VNEEAREELARASQGFYREVFSFIKLNVRLPEPLAKPLHWNLEVVDASGRPYKNVQVHYPQRLAPCTPVQVKQAHVNRRAVLALRNPACFLNPKSKI